MKRSARISIFWRDANERATKSLGAGIGAYFLEGEIGVSHLPLPARACCYGAAMAAVSVLTSLASRRLRKPASGQRTASLVKEVDYIK